MHFKIKPTSSHEWDKEINSWIEQTLIKVGMPDLKIKWTWNKRHFDMGLAFYGEYRVEFSLPLWEKASPADRYETVVHEICHITADHRYGRRCIHGPEWIAEMQRAGFPNPQRCHKVETKQHKQQTRIKASCGCGAVTSLGPTQAKRLHQGKQSYHCTKCNGPIKLIYKRPG